MASRAWLWTLNAREAGLALARLDATADGAAPGTATVPDPERAARALALRVAGSVLVRSGGEGAYLAGGTPGPRAAAAVVHVPGKPVTPVDTNGAGDAHTGALAAHLARGADRR